MWWYLEVRPLGGNEDATLTNGISALIRRGQTANSFSHVRIHKTAIYKPGKSIHQKPDHAATLILDFLPPDLWKIIIYLYHPT